MAGTSQLLEQDFINYRDYTDEKLKLIEGKMDYIMCEMELLKQNGSDYEVGFDNLVGDKRKGKIPVHMGYTGDKGLFRNPSHDEKLRSKIKEENDVQWRRRNNCDEENKGEELKHHKLVFPFNEAPQVENEGESDYNKPPRFDEEPQLEDKAELVYELSKWSSEVSAAKGDFQQPLMLQINQGIKQNSTKLQVLQDSKLHNDPFEKNKPINEVICKHTQSQNEWYATPAPWRDKPEVSIQNFQRLIDFKLLEDEEYFYKAYNHFLKDDKDLKPFTLSFSFFEGVEAASWVNNCEESYYEGPPLYDKEPEPNQTEGGKIGEKSTLCNLQFQNETNQEQVLVLKGKRGEKQLIMLVDSGGTMNFLEEDTTKSLSCYIQPIDPVTINLPNGDKLLSQAWYPKFTWSFGTHSFNTPMWLIKLQTYDAILGTTWLKQLGKIQMDYGNQVISFMQHEENVQLHGRTDSQQNADLNYLTIAQPAWVSQIVESYEGVNFYSTINYANFGETLEGIIVPTTRNTTIVIKRGYLLLSREEIDKIEQKAEKYQAEIKLPNIFSYGKIKRSKFLTFCFDPGGDGYLKLQLLTRRIEEFQQFMRT